MSPVLMAYPIVRNHGIQRLANELHLNSNPLFSNNGGPIIQIWLSTQSASQPLSDQPSLEATSGLGVWNASLLAASKNGSFKVIAWKAKRPRLPLFQVYVSRHSTQPLFAY